MEIEKALEKIRRMEVSHRNAGYTGVADALKIAINCMETELKVKNLINELEEKEIA